LWFSNWIQKAQGFLNLVDLENFALKTAANLNEYLVAKIGFDDVENEPSNVL